MKQSEIKQVKEQLTTYRVPIASISYSNIGDKTQIKDSKSVFDVLISNWEPGTLGANESFYIILMNRAHRINGIIQHSKGGLTGTVTDKRMIIACAVLSLSTSIILAHNHPSGNLQPSETDKQITKDIKVAANILDITVLDHLIITEDNGYFSFADNGLI